MAGPITKFAQQLHADKYRAQGEDFTQSMIRIADALQDNPAHGSALRDMLLNQRFLPAGRVQAGAGAAKEVTLVNCFVMPTIKDSLVGEDSIMDVLAKAAETMKRGGGVGYDFSTLRPRGAHIKTLDSVSSGVVSFMKIFDALCSTIASAGNRRGAQLGCLRVDHPDIFDFIRAKRDNITLTQFNVSVGITDDFMKAVDINGPFNLVFEGKVYQTIQARDLWDEIIHNTWDYAEPGVLFLDTVNRENNLSYCEKIATTNPCFTGETKVWTADGHESFIELVGKEVKVLTQTDDGRLVYRKMFNIRCTQVNAALVKITFDNGSTVTCTPEHKFFLRTGEKISAQDLVKNASIASVYRYKANSKGYLKLAGSSCEILEHHVPFEIDGLGKEFHVHHKNGVKGDNRPDNLEVIDAHEHNSMHMRGDNNPMRRFPERNHFITNVEFSKGKNNGRYRHDIYDTEIRNLSAQGMGANQIAAKFNCAAYTIRKRLGYVAPRKVVNHKVVSVEFLTEKQDVYCGTVEDTHRFFVACGDNDGVLVSNCGEQALPPNGACVLGSFNLTKYIRTNAQNTRVFNFEMFAEDIPHVVRMIDNVNDRSKFPLKEQAAEAQAKRRIGLGITGAANAIEALGQPYGSYGFLAVLTSIMDFMTHKVYAASIELAKEKGPFPLFDAEAYVASPYIQRVVPDLIPLIKKYGIRNSHLMSVAPTGTISLCADNVSSGIEPVFAHSLKRTVRTVDGSVEVDLEDNGVHAFGVYGKTASEVSIQEHLDVLAVAANYCDAAVSKTINVPGTVNFDEFKEIYHQAWVRGVKGCTTFRIDGKRFGILNAPAAEEEAVIEGGACTFDPATGSRTCD